MTVDDVWNLGRRAHPEKVIRIRNPTRPTGRRPCASRPSRN